MLCYEEEIKVYRWECDRSVMVVYAKEVQSFMGMEGDGGFFSFDHLFIF